MIKFLASVVSINLLLTSSLTVQAKFKTEEKNSQRVCSLGWKGLASDSNDCELLNFKIPMVQSSQKSNLYVKANIRSGYLEENKNVVFKGNIIYYEGLGDSMLNHAPLFDLLTKNGFRVIAFDYMGQGGSSGSMNDTRISNIAFLGNIIWKRYARELNLYPKKTIIGWSTGGLAAYVQSLEEKNVNHLVLIAPGLVPNLFVGRWNIWTGDLAQITISTLTTADYSLTSTLDPHIDPIKPSSPLSVPLFSANLIGTAQDYRTFPVNHNVRGFVLLSGKNDTYVDAEATKKVLELKAPHFAYKQYSGALHEIDNETEDSSNPIGPESRQDILQFLLSL